MKGKSSRNAAEEAGKKRKRNSASGGGYDGKKGEKKKLYAFIFHQRQSPNSYSLYAFDIPRPDYTTATGLTHKGRETPPPPPPGVNIDPVLRFSSKEWPSVMGSVCVKSKLYIMGGSFGGLRPLATYPKSVYTLDLSSPTTKALLQSSEFIDDPKKLMVKVADMRTGKVNPRAFKSDGKVYVLSGQDHCLHQRRLQLTQFEVYSPKRDKWTTLPSPPFKNLYLLGHVVVVGRLAIVSGNNGGGGAAAADELFFCYNLDSKVWSRFDTSGWNKLDPRRFCYSENTQVVGNTLYSLCFFPTPSISIVPIKHWKEETPQNNYLVVHKYKISSPRLTTTLNHIRDGLFCSLQVGAPWTSSRDPNALNPHECFMTVTLFRVFGDGRSARYLNSAHYVTHPQKHFFNAHNSFVV